ncbi:sodium-dependent nutrient amino acid transporter 1 [Stomoxys calcitrans]|uniref:sodium-dependent nutrient amino acid transporter 1 n=1 Tax=Stomoxys calcitrans TaxID=35570 RepID=UPI0027E375F7|nr:sodium-dependent nutrient amino acid transporter 1 [Stomoxys calcitrans]XP_013107995.2 sodium-dependent nutrient amino acid transporter 1 [Stomoxys calcitrans]
MAAGNEFESDAGFVNFAYVPSRHASTTSIPGEYRKTLDSIDYTASVKTKIDAASTGDHGIDLNTNKLPLPDEYSQPNISPQRDSWGNDAEFLMSCIALSVGLGNVWRFPFTALDNGGGAFVIPYIIVLFLVGKPVYYMEMLLGQFSSKGSVKVYDFAPIMRGVGYGQVLATGIVTTYYATLMALTLRYFVDSFYSILPWSYCRAEWGNSCIDSKPKTDNFYLQNSTAIMDVKSTSAENYFINVILRQKNGIDDGLGSPSWSLALTLAFSWLVIALIMLKGVKSSGKASYFLALFPYCIMAILLVRSLTLPGAFDGVLYFLKPQWDKLLDPKVWYSAVTQVFFSLAICFGNIIMYASYNRFGHNIKRDCNIVTTLDTFTSLLSGIIIFGILGNLAYESNTTDIRSVVEGGPGLAFISYPDAIAKFKFVPQIFSVLFFLMLFVLGIGSNVGMASCVMTVIKDRFTQTKHWVIVVSIALVCYLLGLMYITPGGQYVLNLLDFYGASFVALVLAIFELLAVGWIYGVKRLCKDIYFMLGIKTSWYYRICWGIITPAFMAAILMYTLVEYKPLQYNDYTYPSGVYVFGWCLSAFGIGQLIFWAVYGVHRRTGATLWEKVVNSFKPKSDWGPLEPTTLKAYKIYVDGMKVDDMFKPNGFWYKIYDNIFN